MKTRTTHDPTTGIPKYTKPIRTFRQYILFLEQLKRDDPGLEQLAGFREAPPPHELGARYYVPRHVRDFVFDNCDFLTDATKDKLGKILYEKGFQTVELRENIPNLVHVNEIIIGQFGDPDLWYNPYLAFNKSIKGFEVSSAFRYHPYGKRTNPKAASNLVALVEVTIAIMKALNEAGVKAIFCSAGAARVMAANFDDLKG